MPPLQQLNAIIAASASVKSSQKLKHMLEVGTGGGSSPSSLAIAGCKSPVWGWGGLLPDPPVPCASPLQIILALGNYMNSSKRGAVYGFKLQSLDLVRGPLPWGCAGGVWGCGGVPSYTL